MLTDRVYMLAADHRWQWEEWCDARGIARPRIAAVKELARRGFELARQRSSKVRQHGALLVDNQYGSESVARALENDVEVGTPAEKAGAFPLQWATEPFADALPGRFVKVLVRHRNDQPQATRQAQLDKLLQLQDWCMAVRRPLVLEVLVPRDREAEDTFEAEGRPAMLASFIRDADRSGLAPDFWKIEGTLASEGARVIDAAIRKRGGRQLILGKAADKETVAAWFAIARSSPSASGFAVGRTVYWGPASAFLLGDIGDAEAVDEIAGSYLALIEAWES